MLAGFRGEAKTWDWETAFVYSAALGNDIASNRISNTLLAEALFDPTPAAYNPFSGGIDSNIERVQIEVFRKTETTLGMWDLKFSNPDLFEMPAGPAGMLVGTEIRRESFEDDRDPRLDGTIDFTDYEGDQYPFTSDVVGSSPTPDGAGSRVTTSLFRRAAVAYFRITGCTAGGSLSRISAMSATPRLARSRSAGGRLTRCCCVVRIPRRFVLRT